jgi:hypothetical protein
MKKDSWFATLDESTDSLMQEAQELFRLVEAHNEQAIDEVKRGLKQEASWRYAGLIFLDAHGKIALRDPKEPLTSSGPVPLTGGAIILP